MVRVAMDELTRLLATAHARGHSVLVTAPEVADGDSIGSQLALAEILRARFAGLDVCIVNADEVPRRYSALPGAGAVRQPDRIAGKKFGVAIVLDGGRERVGTVGALFDAAETTVLFDHHAIGDDYPYQLKVVDPEAAATAELVDQLRRHPGVDVPLTRGMAEALYVALIFDTGYFRHSSTSPRTLRLAADLIATGFDFTRVGERAMLERRYPAVELLARVLGRVARAAAGRIVYSSVLQEDYAATGADHEDRDGIMDQLFLVEGCEIGVLFTQAGIGANASVKCSFRSRSSVDVAAFARSITPHGGGHRKAAGCTLAGELSHWCPKVIQGLTESLSSNAGAR